MCLTSLPGRTRVQLQSPIASRYKESPHFRAGFKWVQGLDLNQGPSGYEPDELPGCSTLQQSGLVISGNDKKIK